MHSCRLVVLGLTLLLAATGCPAPDTIPDDDDDATGDDDDDATGDDDDDATGDDDDDATGDDDDDATGSDVWEELRAAVDGSGLEDVSVLIGTADGTLFVHEKGAITADRPLPIASASKWLTSALTLRLVDEGLMSLDDHPQDYLDWWTNDPADPRSQITLEQLLSFTSGFAGGSGLGGVGGVDCVEDPDTTIDACAQEIYAELHQWAPGTTFFYGPSHMQIIGAMATAASGRSYNQVFRQHIGTPLGLAMTTAFAGPSLANPRPSAGATASGLDYGAFLTALVAGELLTDASRTTMGTDHTPEGVNMANVPESARAFHYALGCWRECWDKTYTEACDGPGVLSSPGAFGFYPWWDTETGIWGVVATLLPSGGSRITVDLGSEWRGLANEAVAASP